VQPVTRATQGVLVARVLVARVDLVAPVHKLLTPVLAVDLVIISLMSLLAGVEGLALQVITALGLLEIPEPPEIREVPEVHRLD